MERRHLLLAATVLATRPLPGLAQRTSRIPTIGLLWYGFAFMGSSMQAFRDELRSRGYIEKRSILIEPRHLVQTVDELDSAA